MLGTASAFLSGPETEAQRRVNEVAAAADTDSINAGLSGECPRQVPGTLQSASHALLCLHLMTTLQVGVTSALQPNTDAQRGEITYKDLRSHSKYVTQLGLKP